MHETSAKGMRTLLSRSRFGWLAAIALCVLVSSCRKAEQPAPPVKLPEGVELHDRTFHSGALGRDVVYRVIEPAAFRPGQTMRVVYLLHGNGSGFEEWSRSSTIAELATRGFVLVMPEGHSSYFMNSATKPQDRFEDFLTHDLIADAERDLPARTDRAGRSIVGVSMGGFAAVVLGLKYPDLYSFIGALSPPVDYPRRTFTFRRLGQSQAIRSIFGPDGSTERAANDPFLLVRKTDPRQSPFVFLAVGDEEGLLEPVSRFDGLLGEIGIPHVYLRGHGGHNWQQWNEDLPRLMELVTSKQN